MSPVLHAVEILAVLALPVLVWLSIPRP